MSHRMPFIAHNMDVCTNEIDVMIFRYFVRRNPPYPNDAPSVPLESSFHFLELLSQFFQRRNLEELCFAVSFRFYQNRQQRHQHQHQHQKKKKESKQRRAMNIEIIGKRKNLVLDQQ